MAALNKPHLNVPTYLVPVLLGLLGVLAAQYVESPLLSATVILVSLAGALFAGGSLYSRLRGSLWERYTVVSGMVLVTLGAVATVSGIDRAGELPGETPGAVARVSHVAATGSLILGLTVILVAVLRRGRAISELSQRFSSFAAHSREGFVLLSPAGRISYANERFAGLCGAAPDDLLGMDLDALAVRLDCAPFSPRGWHAKRTEPWEAERAWAVAGRERQFAIAGAPVTDYRDRMAGTLLTVRDITEERRLAETVETYTQGLEEVVEERTRRLRASQERLRNLLLHMREGFMTVDGHLTIRFANERLAQMLGLAADALDGRKLSGFIAPAEHGRLLELCDALLTRREAIAPQEFTLRGAGGETPVVIAAGRAQEGEPDAGDLLSLVVTDISELKRMQRQLEERALELENANAELQMLDRAKDSFLSTVTHELRTPLSTMRGYLEMLASGSLGPVAPNQTSVVEVMRRNANRLGTLIDELLEFSRMEVKGVALNRSLVAIEEVVQETADSWRPEYEQRGVALDVDVPEEAPLVWADRRRVAQALSTLLSNAAKFTPEGKRVVTRYEVTPGGEARVSVSDSGIGISKENRERIFDKFYQIDSSLNRRYEGAGIGLSIAKAIAQAHGGAIELDSAEHAGATFTLALPGAAFAPPEAGEPGTRLRGGAMLLVCDDAALGEQLRRLAEKAGAHVTLVREGGGGFRAAAEVRHDIAVVDHVLPDTAGAEVAAQLTARGEDGPACLLLTDPSRPGSIGTSPSVRLLPRPFTQARFLEAVEAALSGAGQAEPSLTEGAGFGVLVVDRDPDMLEWLEAALAGQGMSCRCARDVEEAEAAAEMRRPALILAEAERRNMTYLQSSPDLRDIPVVLLTSDDSVGENGDGAVGILKKPFAIADVVARVNALRDRSGSFHTP